MDIKRVLLKLSGEALAGDKHTGFDEATVVGVARQVRKAVDSGVQMGIVIGRGWYGTSLLLYRHGNRTQGYSDRGRLHTSCQGY